MHAIEGSNFTTGPLYTGGADGNIFTAGPPATVVTAEFLNAIQGEFLNVIISAGLTPLTAATDTRTQLASAIALLGAGGLSWTWEDPLVAVANSVFVSSASWVDIDISAAVPADTWAVMVNVYARSDATPDTCNFSIFVRESGFSTGAAAVADTPGYIGLVTDQNTASNPAQIGQPLMIPTPNGTRTLQIIHGVSSGIYVTCRIIGYLS